MTLLYQYSRKRPAVLPDLPLLEVVTVLRDPGRGCVHLETKIHVELCPYKFSEKYVLSRRTPMGCWIEPSGLYIVVSPRI